MKKLVQATCLPLALLLLSSCVPASAPTESAMATKQEIAVSVRPAALSSMATQANFAGRIMPEGQTMLFSKIPGKVTSVRVATGDTVQAGDTLFVLDDSDISMQVNQASSAVKVAQAGYDTQQEQLESAINGAKTALDGLAQTLADADTALAAGAMTKEQYAQVKGNYESAKIQYDNAVAAGNSGVSAAQLDQAKTAYNSARSQLGYAKVKAPISGKLTLFTPKLHEMVGNAQPVAIIANEEAVNCEFYVSPSYVTRVQVSDLVYVTFTNHAGTETKTSATVTEIAALPGENGLFTVKTIAEYMDAPIGSSIVITVETERRDDVVSLPLDTVRSDVKGSFVYLSDSGVAKKVYVETGLTNSTHVEIVQGVQKGDPVISSWNNLLSDGAPLREIQE